jgi:hypothetical protein
MISAKSTSINQPYFFPYIGYFQLIHASVKFISLEDVNYITGGWINRNRILINGEAAYFSLPIIDASQNRKINETRVLKAEGWKESILKKLRMSYSRAPYYSDCFKLVSNTLNISSDLISDTAFQSILEVCNYVGLRREFGKSSGLSDLKGEEKIIEICLGENADTYFNLPGGENIYNKDSFSNQGITLRFIEPEIREYKQFKEPFVPSLSIIDVLMFNSPDTVSEMISSYTLK